MHQEPKLITIFIKITQGPQGLPDKPIMLEVNQNETVQSVKGRFVKLLNKDFGGSQVLLFAPPTHKLMKNELAISEYVFNNNTTLEAQILVARSYDTDVEPILKKDLGQLLQASEPTFVLISLGSYDHGHGEASIKRQQCPDELRSFCVSNKLKLRIFLIDLAFASDNAEPGQIYNIDKNWKLSKSFPDGKVRFYKYAEQDFELRVYATDVPADEYDGTSPTLAGVPLKTIKDFIASNKGQMIEGDIYSSKIYITTVDGEAFIKLGFKDK